MAIFGSNPSTRSPQTTTQIRTVRMYRDPRTGRQVSEKERERFVHWYKRRYKKRPLKEIWWYVLDHQPLKPKQKRIKGQTYLRIGQKYHRIQDKARLTQIEKILPIRTVQDRHMRTTLARHQVFQKIWDNTGGEIRVTVNGWQGGRRLKEIIHLAYHRGHWMEQKDGREKFKDWLTSSIVSNLRRRGLRLSNPKESTDRIGRLRKELEHDIGFTEFVKPERMGGHVNKIKWKQKAIQQQKKLKQITRATLRIEKMI